MGDIWWGIQYFVLLVSSLVFGRAGTLGSAVGMLVFLVFNKLW